MLSDKTIKYSIPILILLYIITSCTTPPPELPPGNWFSILPQQSSFYLYVDMKQTENMFNQIIQQMNPENNDLNTLLERTDKAFIGVKYQDGVIKDYSIVALGDYPSFFINLNFCTSGEWQEREASGKYWQNTEQELQVAVPIDNVILASNKNIEQMLQNYTSRNPMHITNQVTEEIESSTLSMFFPVGLEQTLSTQININPTKIKIEEILISACNIDSNYNFKGMFKISNQKGARLFTVIFKTAFLAFLRSSGVSQMADKLKAIKFITQDTIIRVTGFYLTEREMIDILFNILKGEEV